MRATKGSVASLALSMNVNDLEEVKRIYLKNVKTYANRPHGDRRHRPGIARTSWTDEDGTVYVYSDVADEGHGGTIDGLRLDRCEPAVDDLRVPERLQDRPVVSIGAGAFQQLPMLRRLELPDSIIRIGSNAFVGCESLEYLKLPAAVPTVDPFWFRDCKSLTELILPDEVEALGLGLLESCQLKRLSIGKKTRSFAYGFFKNTQLSSIAIDPENPYLSTDGHAIYDHGFTRLIAQVVRTPVMTVPATCRSIERKAFMFDPVLREIVLPDTLETIGGYAFAHTGLSRFHAPRALRSLETKAFFRCEELTTATLNEGLETLGDEVFAQTSLESLTVPATVSAWGKRIAARTPVIPSGPEATFSLDPDNPWFLLAPDGALYRREESSLTLIEHLDNAATHCQVLPGTASVGYRAFIRHPSIQDVELPEGLRVIGDAAFRGCSHLRRIIVPDTLERIGAEAFLDTSLESLEIPRSLESIGRIALITRGGNRAVTPPTLTSISVDPENPRFYMDSGFLCERKADGTARILVFSGPGEDVVIPDEANDIEEYAMTGVVGLHSLRAHNHLRYLGTSCLSLGSPVTHLYLEFPSPIEGRSEIDLKLPQTYGGQRVLTLGTTNGRLDIPLMARLCDNAILAIDRVSVRAEFAMDRLLDPLLLDEDYERRFKRMLRRNLVPISVAFARSNNYRGFDKLAETGFLNPETLTAVIDAVNDADEVEMTGYLLQMKRNRFGDTSLDFEL